MSKVIKEIKTVITYKYDEKGNVIEKREETIEKHFEKDSEGIFIKKPEKDLPPLTPIGGKPWWEEPSIRYLSDTMSRSN